MDIRAVIKKIGYVLQLHHDIAEEVFVAVPRLEKHFVFPFQPPTQQDVLLLFGQLVPSLMQLNKIWVIQFLCIFVI